MELSEISLITIISLVISFILFLIKIILKSKCYEFNCLWNCISIKRDVKIEEQLEEVKIMNNYKSNDNIDINNILTNVKNNNIIK